MNKRSSAGVSVIMALCLSLGFAAPAHAQKADAQPHPPVPNTGHKEEAVVKHASGPFDVKLSPQTDDKAGDPSLGRMSIDKQYHGDLEATSKGQMLTAMSGDVKGSGVYVAVERVTGTLDGRTGTFALHHTGIMTRGVPQLTITVVPDSGTGQLAGLAGKMDIKIVDGKHSYDFEYTLPEAK
jgi:hypothetical protein